MNLNGTQTEKNLLISFAGESQARNRYTYYAGKAKKEGFQQIAAIFDEIAAQEKEHAKRFFKFLDGGDVEILASFPAGKIGRTEENLNSAIAGENHEHSRMYPDFAGVARKEGFDNIAEAFEAIAIAERQHESRFKKCMDDLVLGCVFQRDEIVFWRCRNCGYVHEAKKAPEICPACVHPQGFFEILCEN